MEWTRSKKIIACLFAGAFFVAAGSCGLIPDEDDKKGDPVPEATGNIAVTAASEVTLGMVDALLSTSGALKPASIGTVRQSTLRDKNCGGGGTVDFTPDNPTGSFTATMTNCEDENVVINGTVTGTVGPTTTCDDEELPTSMSGVFNGTVLVTEVENIEFTFTDFGVEATGISYGPDCDLDGTGAGFTAEITGKIKGDLDLDVPGVGTDFSIDFGSGSLTVDVTSIIDTNGIKGDGIGRVATMNMDGTVTIDSPCAKGDVTINADGLQTSQPDACPFAGSATYSSEAFGDASVVFDGSCDFVACEIDAGDLLP